MKLVDPLAQSFYVEPKSGIFVTSVDLYFFSKDPELPITVQLRPMYLGFPTNKVYPFSEVVVDAKDVNVSDDGSVATKVTFKSPVYLSGSEFHCICLLSNSSEYLVWLSRLGEIDTESQTQLESKQIVVTKQPLSGSIFKSQNGITWNSSDFDDLKFKLYRASFGISGDVNFYNSDLSIGNKEVAQLVKRPLSLSSRKVKVGLGTTLSVSNLPTLGNTIVQKNSSVTGNYVGYAGSCSGNLTIVNSGIGYTPSSGNRTFTGVALTSVTGTGKNATANIHISNGVAVAATIQSGGTGYIIGDLLSANQIGNDTLGRNIRLSVSSLSGINELIVDQVQGEFLTGVGNTLQYINNSGVTTDLKQTAANILANSIELQSDGLHIKVNHKNHGMHSPTNTVSISNVRPDTVPTKLLSNYDLSSTTDILVEDEGSFTFFENVGVGTTNLGYAKIGNEIISYSGTSVGSLTGITRSVDQTITASYVSGTEIYKYEIGSVSLRRINKDHVLEDSAVDESIGLDHYHIKIDMSSNGIDRSTGSSFPKLYLNETKSAGGSRVNASQNIQYEIIRPNIETLNLNGTKINASIRTISGTSVSGNEESFDDQGFEQINLNANNYLNSPRLICSKVNENSKLTTLPGKKSFTLNMRLLTANTYISPLIDLHRAGMILTSNRVNDVITDYVEDERVSTLKDDPTAFVYATKPISLETPATSIKLYVNAYVNVDSDIRALFAIANDPKEEMIYYPFPGYDNLSSSGENSISPSPEIVKKVIDRSKNSGRPDRKRPKSTKTGFFSKQLEFIEHEFTIDQLPAFRYFSVKLLGTSTNQTYPPRFSQLRVIALA